MRRLRARVAGGMGVRVLGAAAALALTSAAAAQPAPGRPAVPEQPPEVRTIRVDGVGEVEVTPDEAYIELAVETEAASAKLAGQRNAKAMEAVIRALKREGLADAALETRGYSVQPRYRWPKNGGKPTIEGYTAVNNLSVKVTDLDRVGPLVDVGLAAGANRINGVRFELSDPDAVRGRALTLAVERARGAAEAMAAALEVGLGPVLDASTTSEPIHVPMMRMAMESADQQATTPIRPQAQTVRATVTVVYAIAGRPRR